MKMWCLYDDVDDMFIACRTKKDALKWKETIGNVIKIDDAVIRKLEISIKEV